jgi:ferritin-like metal-binding protein YciE
VSALSNPRDLFLQQLAELLWVERTLEHEVLPTAIDEVADEDLKQALSDHLEETREHVRRVEHAFLAAGAEPAASRTEVLAPQGRDVKEPTLAALAHAGEAARIEHLEIALYDVVIGLAPGKAAGLLEQNRKEEEQALAVIGRQAKRLRGALPR